jgi:outer membrane immunogenic protein
VGAEAKLGSNWMARLEYLHYDFGTVENATTFVSPGISSASEGGRQTIDVARAALSYKFGPHREASAAYGSGSIKDDPCCAAAPWAGFYLGVHGGYGWKDNSFSERINSSVSIPGIESEGRLFGAHAGYNWQYGSVVAGIEADFSSTNIRGETTVIQNLVLPRPITSADDVKYLGSARARLGFEAANNVLLYGTGGLAWERVERTETRVFKFDPNPSSTQTFTPPFDRFGWVAGVGAEAKLGSNWVARLEYLHYDFGTAQAATKRITEIPTDSAFQENGGHQRIDVLRAALSYKF